MIDMLHVHTCRPISSAEAAVLVESVKLLCLLQRQFAFEAAFHCIDEAYKAKGPFLRHACHFRAERCDNRCAVSDLCANLSMSV